MSAIQIQRIHHPTDFSRESEVAYHHALRLAVASRANLDILHVDHRAHAMEWLEFPCVNETLEQWGMVRPGALGNELAGIHVEKIAAYGKEPVKPILDHLDEFPADLMVLATHRRHGFDRWLHKEIAQRIARSRSVKTLFVPHGCEGFVSPSTGAVTLSRILVPVDWIPNPRVAVEAADELAHLLLRDEVKLTLFHVASEKGDMPAVDLPRRQGFVWDERTGQGDVVEAILAEASEADLIVMATQGRDGFLDALRGSTTERVLQQAKCPVLAVPVADY